MAGYRLVYSMEVRSDWDIRQIDVDAKTGEIVRSFSKIQTDDHDRPGHRSAWRPAQDEHRLDKLDISARSIISGPRRRSRYDFRGSLSRLNSFLATGLLFNSDIATDSDNVWSDGPTVDAHVYQGLGARLLLQAIRAPRTRRSQPRDRRHRASARPIASEHAAVRCRRTRSSTTRSSAATG